jgi:uncharacterized protein YcbK (DUF882 family)
MKQLSKNFTSAEFACKCGCGFDTPDPHLIHVLQRIRDDFKAPLVITSGCRCKAHNTTVGGATTSQHVQGKAVDIKCLANNTRYKIVQLALKHGVKRIGLAKTFIHLDVGDHTAPQEVIWFY